MGAQAGGEAVNRLRALVAIASYGAGNDSYLERIVREYRAMDLAVDIVVLSNIDKGPALGVECRVGFPGKTPLSLPFAHVTLFAERRDEYDLFIYCEDDILITERNLRAWLEVDSTLGDDEIAGFLRIERGPGGAVSYPDAHGRFHWDCASVRRRGPYTLAAFSNEHAACYVATRAQLRRALQSGGFDGAPHDHKYDMLCTAATDIYTQCGMTKLIPVSRMADFQVHHMSDRYFGKLGLAAEEFDRQIGALMCIADAGVPRRPLVPTETRLWRCEHSKIYYERASAEAMGLIPARARSVLSIGCGSGEIEAALSARGLKVVGIPMDPVIAASAAARGVKLIEAMDLDMDAAAAARSFAAGAFDCVLCSNVLHLAVDPMRILTFAGSLMHSQSTLVILTPNMMSLRTFRGYLKTPARATASHAYEDAGAHFTSLRVLKGWCESAGFEIDGLIGVASPRHGMRRTISTIGERLPKSLRLLFATSLVATATLARISERQAA